MRSLLIIIKTYTKSSFKYLRLTNEDKEIFKIVFYFSILKECINHFRNICNSETSELDSTLILFIYFFELYFYKIEQLDQSEEDINLYLEKLAIYKVILAIHVSQKRLD